MRRFPRLSVQLLCFSLILSLPGATWALVDGGSFEQRNQFKLARDHLRQGRISSFKRSMSGLRDYQLYPYLVYYDLNRRISTLSAAEINRFRQQYADLPVTGILYRRWLTRLGRNAKWDTLLRHYEPTNNAELRCLHLRSIYRNGDKDQALAETAALWVAPQSQPKACDPLFEVWRASSYFTEDVAWQRLYAAVSARELGLAGYLLRYLSGDNRRAGEQLINVHRVPARAASKRRFPADTQRMREVMSYGLTRLSKRDPVKALNAWQQYQPEYSFDAASESLLSQTILAQLALQEGVFPDTEQRKAITQAQFQLDLALAGVRQQNWPEAEFWISQLPVEERNKSQWTYWLGRALSEQAKPIPERFNSLARERHYYGFLAARLIGLPGKLNAAANGYNALQAVGVAQQANIARAIELFAVGDDLNGRREWFAGLRNLPQADQAVAAAIAAELGMVSLAIRSANTADASDHLHLRFPLAHEPAFRQASLTSGLPAATLFAIARQESALQSDARSTADARGLMQLLPSTAKLVARRAKLRSPAANDLYDPSTNIQLGSYHLAWLAERYDGQLPLAAAAYNAGEHRVDRWIKDQQGQPMDVWIEKIPFHETRNYVKNVLAFRHVYSRLLNSPSPILTTTERYVTSR